MNVGERIKYFRVRRNLTVNRLANKAGISQSYLRDVELGKKQPTVEYLSYICDALNISLKTFFSEETPNNELVALIGNLTEDQQLHLIKFIKSILS